MRQTVRALLLEHFSPEKADEIAGMLSEGRWTHDYPINFDEAKAMGLRVSDAMPAEVYALMDLYPQARQRRPGVEYIPAPYQPAPPAPRRTDPH